MGRGNEVHKKVSPKQKAYEEKQALKALALKQNQAAEDARQAQRNAAANDAAARQKRNQAAKQAYITSVRGSWNALINGVVGQVVALRAANGGGLGINAGENAAGDTEGGTKNPVALNLPGPNPGVTKADVLSGMVGLDSSDSGYYKFRRQEVLVHCK